LRAILNETHKKLSCSSERFANSAIYNKPKKADHKGAKTHDHFVLTTQPKPCLLLTVIQSNRTERAVELLLRCEIPDKSETADSTFQVFDSLSQLLISMSSAHKSCTNRFPMCFCICDSFPGIFSDGKQFRKFTSMWVGGTSPPCSFGTL
jgi:hypothetical protein